MTLADAIRDMSSERLTKPLQTKVTPRDSNRIDIVASKLGMTRAALTRALVLHNLDQLERDLQGAK